MPASEDTIGSDDMRPGRSGPDTGTEEAGQGAEFLNADDSETISEADRDGFRRAHGSAE